jgi:hypothetical protein
MSQTFSAGQSLKRDCLAPYHITLAWCPGETKQRFPVPAGVDGKTLVAYRVNRWTGQRLREKPFHILPDSRVELFKSQWTDLFYIVELDRYRQRWLCSCERELCEHIKAMRGISR